MAGELLRCSGPGLRFLSESGRIRHGLVRKNRCVSLCAAQLAVALDANRYVFASRVLYFIASRFAPVNRKDVGRTAPSFVWILVNGLEQASRLPAKVGTKRRWIITFGFMSMRLSTTERYTASGFHSHLLHGLNSQELTRELQRSSRKSGTERRSGYARAKETTTFSMM